MIAVVLTLDSLSAAERDALALLLRDALGEFIDVRRDHEATTYTDAWCAERYVRNRYRGQSDAFRARKIVEVQARLALARKLHDATSSVGFQEVCSCPDGPTVDNQGFCHVCGGRP